MYTYRTEITCIKTAEYISEYRNTEKFIVFCKQCNKYGNCWACPPYDFNTTDYMSKYDKAYIIGTKIMLSEDIKLKCTDAEESKTTGAKIVAEVRSILDKQLLKVETEHPDSRAFFAGTCHLCDAGDCTRIKNEACRYPDMIRHSLESFGFDIGKTAQDLLGIELKWSNDGSLPEYLTLVSGLFTNNKIRGIENYFTEK